MALDFDAELERIEQEDVKLAQQADKLAENPKGSYTETREKLKAINAERRALAERGEAVRTARRMGDENARALHQVLTEAGAIESQEKHGTPSAGGR